MTTLVSAAQRHGMANPPARPRAHGMPDRHLPGSGVPGIYSRRNIARTRLSSIIASNLTTLLDAPIPRPLYCVLLNYLHPIYFCAARRIPIPNYPSSISGGYINTVITQRRKTLLHRHQYVYTKRQLILHAKNWYDKTVLLLTADTMSSEWCS